MLGKLPKQGIGSLNHLNLLFSKKYNSVLSFFTRSLTSSNFLQGRPKPPCGFISAVVPASLYFGHLRLSAWSLSSPRLLFVNFFLKYNYNSQNDWSFVEGLARLHWIPRWNQSLHRDLSECFSKFTNLSPLLLIRSPAFTMWLLFYQIIKCYYTDIPISHFQIILLF